MTTPDPTGRLIWSQAGTYDAVDDRYVIRALARGKVGTLAPVIATAGIGLQVIVRGGWLGVASCDDGTSGIVGAREDHYVLANAGPASGSREDWLWCETHPEEATWNLRILPAAQAALLPGIQLARITVPQGANLASQMTIVGTTAELDRRLLSYSALSYEFGAGGWSHNTWGGGIVTAIVSEPVTCRWGQWYRVTHEMNSPDKVQGAASGAFIGVGWRPSNQPQNTAQLAQASTHAFPMAAAGGGGENWRANAARVSWVFRYTPVEPQVRLFEGRFWMEGNGLFRMGTRNGIGPHQILTVEDLGS